ncbi:hypothetical protein ACHAPU_000300 [Fusarium lateritium]
MTRRKDPRKPKPKVIEEDTGKGNIEEAPTLEFNNLEQPATNITNPGPFFRPPYYQPNFNTPGQGSINHGLPPQEQQLPPGFGFPTFDTIGFPYQPAPAAPTQPVYNGPSQGSVINMPHLYQPSPAAPTQPTFNDPSQGFVLNMRRPYQQPPPGTEQMFRLDQLSVSDNSRPVMIDPDTGGPIININPDIKFTDPWKPSTNPRDIPRRDSNVSPKTLVPPIHVTEDQDTLGDSSQRQARSQSQEQPFQQDRQDVSIPSQASKTQSSRKGTSVESYKGDLKTPRTISSTTVTPATPPSPTQLYRNLEVALGLRPDCLPPSQEELPNKPSTTHPDK